MSGGSSQKIAMSGRLSEPSGNLMYASETWKHAHSLPDNRSTLTKMRPIVFWCRIPGKASQVGIPPVNSNLTPAGFPLGKPSRECFPSGNPARELQLDAGVKLEFTGGIPTWEAFPGRLPKWESRRRQVGVHGRDSHLGSLPGNATPKDNWSHFCQRGAIIRKRMRVLPSLGRIH